MRNTKANIILSNLAFNFRALKSKAADKKFMAVVKADAYGHGMVKCVEALEAENPSPDYYAVALVEEAIELRKSGVTNKPILSFAPYMYEDISAYIEYGVLPTITSYDHIKELSKIKLTKKLKAHVNIDTGMGRVGLRYDEAVEQLSELSKNEYIEIDGIYTHLSTSDEADKSYSKLQLSRFNDILISLRKQNIEYHLAHASNSGAVIDLPEAYSDMIRPGVSLYGYYPSNETTESVILKPVMELTSEVSGLRTIKKGEYVSYGRKYKADEDIKTATVPIGYADGVYRALSGKFSARINGKLAPQIGRVTMDRIVFDVTNIECKPGDKVLLFGNDEQCNVNEWCSIVNTIPYEITCAVSKRVPRIYV